MYGHAGHEPLLKVIVLGDVSVGKSALLRRFHRGDFDPTPEMTLGPCDFPTKTVGGVALQLWDTYGQERFIDVFSGAVYRGADVCLLVFDTHSTMMKLERWLLPLLQLSPMCVVIVVGTKADLEGSLELSPEIVWKSMDAPSRAAVQVAHHCLNVAAWACGPSELTFVPSDCLEEVLLFLAAVGPLSHYPYFEVSAKDGRGVPELFEAVARMGLEVKAPPAPPKVPPPVASGWCIVN